MNYTPIKDWSDDDKPREKLIKWGASTLSDSELLGILISTGSRGKSAIELARELLQLAENDISQLARFSIEDIQRIKGLGTAKAVTILAALELSKRHKFSQNEKNSINSIEDAVKIIQPILQDKAQEHFYVLLLSRRNAVLKIVEISKGGIATVSVDPRIILKSAIMHQASAIILAHNHPSGSLQPSKADIQLTEKIKKGAEIMDIQVLDHIIISGNRHFSFNEQGLV